MTVSWALYKSELKSPTPEERRADRTTVPDQMTGFWRRRAAKMKPDYPVLIYTDGDNPTTVQVGPYRPRPSTDVEGWQTFLDKDWLYCEAVEKADFEIALKTGFWPDDQKPALKMTDEEKLGIDVSTGGNNPPIDESLADQIAAMVAKIEAMKVTDQPSADAASGALDKMRKLLELATIAFEAEKAPFLEGGRQVDAKWHGIRDPGIAAGAKLKVARETWLKNEQARLNAIAEAENKKAREAAAAENARLQKIADDAAEAEAQRLRDEAAKHGQPVDEQEIAARVAETAAPVVEVKPVVVEPEKAKASSAFGRATSAKKTKRAVVDDLARLASFFCLGGGTIEKPEPDADFLEYATKRAERARKAGTILPGCIVIEE